MSIAMIMADCEGRIRYWNDDATVLFGYPAFQAMGQTLDLIVPEAFRERHWSGFHAAMTTHQCHIDRAAQNLPVLCADGQVRTFPARFVFLQDAYGLSAGALVLYSSPTGEEQPFTPVARGPRL